MGLPPEEYGSTRINVSLPLKNNNYYSQLLPCGPPAIADAHYYGQNSDPQQKL